MSPVAEQEEQGRKPVRWWIAVLILIGMAAAIAWTWTVEKAQRQERVLETVAVLLPGSVLLLLWVLFLSRLPWRVRGFVLGVCASAAVLTLALFRFAGVTGDVVPILEPRWRSRAARAVETVENVAVTLASSNAAALSFPQFLGPNRDGVVRDTVLATDWSNSPPVLMWRRSVGEGWGGFAIAAGRALTQEQDGPEELVTCCELATGRLLWAHRYPARYDNPIGGIGPRCTPTVAGDRAFTMGATGILKCLDLETGSVRWECDTLAGMSSLDLEWGVSSSPLVYSHRVVVSPRGALSSLLAYHADTGELLWSAGEHKPGYSSPRLESIHGVSQILTFTSQAAAAHDPETGRLLWEYPWRFGQRGHPHVTDPRVVETNRVLISTAYGAGSHLVEITRGDNGASWFATNVIWRSLRLKSKFANLLPVGEYVYALDDGRLVCIDLKDGSRRWDGERLGHGQLLLVGQTLLVTAENGEVVLVEASPEAYVPLARFQAFERKTWNPPALAGDVLLIRNDKEAAAYRLPTETTRVLDQSLR